MSPKIFLDTNAFIEAFEEARSGESSIWPIFEALETAEFSASTSAITLAELLPKLLANGQTDIAALYQRLFREQTIFQAIPITQDVLVQSAQLRAARLTLRLPDAIHLATASTAGCAVVLSNDRRLSSFGGIPVVRLAADTLSRVRGLS